MLVIITGASQGIGAAIAEAFAREPSSHVVLLARNEDNLNAVAGRCRDAGAQADVFPCDVTRDADVEAIAERIMATSGPPDVLINNAGLFRPGSLLETDAATFREQLAVNLTSAFVVTKAFLPALVEARRGHVFFTASVASIKAYSLGAAYCAAKHGLLGLARVMREEMKEHGIRVTALLPGATLTPAWDGVSLPEDRLMPAADIARAVVDVHRMSERTVVEEIVLRPQLGDL